MPSSRRFKQLLKRLAVLRTHLLPPQFSPTGQYSDKDYDLTRAYVVLVHAEIEAYCEDRSRKVAQKAHRLWRSKGRRSAILLKLLEFHRDCTQQPWVAIDKSKSKIEKAINYYMSSVIDQNHGIREENLSKVFFPIGI